MKLFGGGLLTGFKVTLQALLRRSVTAHYPDALPELPARSRGVIALMEENCTVCMLCARECPAWCIHIDSHKETEAPVSAGARERSHNVLDRFAIDFSLCMYCSICIEVCPFDALHWTPEFEYAEYDIRDLVHEKERLQEWMWTAPAPPALDVGAAPAKEATAAARAADRERAAVPAAPAAPAASAAQRSDNQHAQTRSLSDLSAPEPGAGAGDGEPR